MFSRAKNVKVRVFPLFRGDAMNKRSLEHFIIEYFKDEDIQDFKIGEMIFVKVEKIEPAEAIHTDRHTRPRPHCPGGRHGRGEVRLREAARREHRRIPDLLRPGKGVSQAVPGRKGAVEEGAPERRTGHGKDAVRARAAGERPTTRAQDLFDPGLHVPRGVHRRHHPGGQLGQAGGRQGLHPVHRRLRPDTAQPERYEIVRFAARVGGRLPQLHRRVRRLHDRRLQRPGDRPGHREPHVRHQVRPAQHGHAVPVHEEDRTERDPQRGQLDPRQTG